MKIVYADGPGVVNFNIPFLTFLNKYAGIRKLGKLKKPGKCLYATLTLFSLNMKSS